MLDILAGYLDYIAALAPAWGYFFIFFFMAVESSFIPFPSEIVMIPAGFLAARGELTCGIPHADLVLSVCAGLAGSLAGAFFNYWLSAKLGEPFLRKHGRKFFIKPEALDRAYEIFNKYDEYFNSAALFSGIIITECHAVNAQVSNNFPLENEQAVNSVVSFDFKFTKENNQ